MENNYNLEPRSQWSSPMRYFIVTLGAIVGIGNIIQFPYLVTQYGGLFLVLFIFFEIFISVPLLFCELIIGRRGKQDPVGSISLLSMEANANPFWKNIGWLCFLVSVLTLGYYSVQSSFPLAYLLGLFNVISIYGADEPVKIAVHGDVMTQFYPLEFCFILFLIATMLVIVRGINRGLETISLIFVPMYFIILFVLAIYISSTGYFLNSFKILINMHSTYSFVTILFAAMTYALYRLNIGMGIMIVYGSYLPYTTSFGKTTLWIVFFDILTSIAAFFIIYPLMLQSNFFMQNLNNHNIIYIFSGVQYGFVIAALFFFAAILAAWTCTIALAETAVVTLVGCFHISRLRAVIIVTVVALAVGTFAALSHTTWVDVMLTNSLGVKGITKNITGNILTPLSAILIAIFAGWIMKRNVSSAELRFNPIIYNLWRFIIRYIAPVFIFAVVLGTMLVVFIPTLI